MRFLFIVFVFLLASPTFSQSKKERSIEGQSNSFEPYYSKEEKAQIRQIKKSSKRSYKAAFNKNLDRKVREYEERMEANVKRDRKLAREMQKPQYSDPSYFGHKRKPKKRPMGKRKFCKECEIIH